MFLRAFLGGLGVFRTTALLLVTPAKTCRPLFSCRYDGLHLAQVLQVPGYAPADASWDVMSLCVDVSEVLFTPLISIQLSYGFLLTIHRVSRKLEGGQSPMETGESKSPQPQCYRLLLRCKSLLTPDHQRPKLKKPHYTYRNKVGPVNKR